MRPVTEPWLPSDRGTGPPVPAVGQLSYEASGSHWDLTTEPEFATQLVASWGSQ